MALPTLAVSPGSGATINTLPPGGQAPGASSIPVVLASDQPPIPTQCFTPSRTTSGNNPTTVPLAVLTTATGAPVAFPACQATSIRVKNSQGSSSPITFVVSTSNTIIPVLPVPYSQSGTGGTPGDMTIDPGGIESFGLTAAQQTALAAGALYLAAICSSGSGILYVTPGNGA